MAPLEIRLDYAETTGPLYAAVTCEGSRPACPAGRSQSKFWQLCDRSPVANRGFRRCALKLAAGIVVATSCLVALAPAFAEGDLKNDTPYLWRRLVPHKIGTFDRRVPRSH